MILRDVLSTLTAEDRTTFLPLFHRAVKINIQNVADYSHSLGDKDWSIDKDFPNCAPPWPLFWMEWKRHTSCEGPIGIGVLAEAERIHEDDDPIIQGGWALKCTLFLSWELRTKVAIIFAVLDSNGRHIPERDDEREREGAKVGVRLFGDWDGRSGGQEKATAVSLLLFVPYLALSFCHCRNVDIVEHLTPHKLAKAQEKRGRFPILSHYTLAIGPMSRTLTDCAPAGTSLNQRLHICRGHFKDYRVGGGLFGKQKGLYWWDMNLRGNSAKGAIVKDYAISP